MPVRYSIEDFTIESYVSFIRLAKERGYEFTSYDKIDTEKKQVLWRHDLDLSVKTAHRIAIEEAMEGIQANYFLLLHSPFYNLLDSYNSSLIKEIIDLGHHIGLHFDSHYYNISNAGELNNHLESEKNLLESLFKKEIKVFSFHLNNSFTLNCKEWQYNGLINTYADFFQSKAEYCSDSYGLWRFKRIPDFIAEAQSNTIQVLTHPEWWVHPASMPKERIQRIIEDHSNDLWTEADKYYIYKEA